jgi:hypothetical protein
MYSVMMRINPDDLESLLKHPRCTCERHAPYALGHVWTPDSDMVYLVTRCYRCKRVKTTFLGNIFAWHLSFQEDEIIVPVESAILYEQTAFLP